MGSLVEKASELIGLTISDAEPLHGGSLSTVFRLQIADGRSFIAKPGHAAKTEAQMLKAIRSAGAPVPCVVAVSSDLLILEDLGPNEGPENAWNSLGQDLRRLHATRGTYFGWPEDHSFGTVDIPNAPTQSWPEF